MGSVGREVFWFHLFFSFQAKLEEECLFSDSVTGLKHQRNVVAHTLNSEPLLVMVKQNSEFPRNLLKMLMSIGIYVA